MTPQEEAGKIIDMFIPLTAMFVKYSKGNGYFDRPYEAKQCALIHVNGLLAEIWQVK
jgi:hypothetical protein